MDLNRVTLIGTLKGEPVEQDVPEGQHVIAMALAERDTLPGAKGAVIHNVVARGKLAQIVKTYVHSGAKLYVEGKLQADGLVLADNLILLGHRHQPRREAA